MSDDVLINKTALLERCKARVREEYAGGDSALDEDFTRQDALVLNLLRACETAIDLAMHAVRVLQLGVPQRSRDAFDLLAGAGVIDADLAGRLKGMVGFRNIAIHQYQALEFAIVRAIVETRLDDFTLFTRSLFARL